MINYFKNRKLVIATMHKKENIIKPILEKKLWVNCILLKDFNTDIFWTFTRDIKRTWSMIDAARLKINKALDLSWFDLGISSEWSFWLHNSMPFTNSNFELTLLIDRKNNFEIIWYNLSSDTNLNWKYVSSIKEAFDTAKKWWFPEHWIIVRLNEKSRLFINKGINNKSDLEKWISKILSLPFVKKVYIETDMRAFKNPTRMKNIKLSIIDLLKNINSFCPTCSTPWFCINDIEIWLPCWDCLSPTNMPTYEIYTCNKCGFIKKNKIKKYGKYADPWNCINCNP